MNRKTFAFSRHSRGFGRHPGKYLPALCLKCDSGKIFISSARTLSLNMSAQNGGEGPPGEMGLSFIGAGPLIGR